VKSALTGVEKTNWVEHVGYFERVNNHPNMLVAWLGGDVFSESLSDSQVSKDLTAYLRRILNRKDIPEPTKIVRSRWASQKYFKGSYTNMPVGSFPEDFDRLANPILVNNVISLCIF
jgi:spermine oxidase